MAESDADDEGGVVEAGDQVERLALGKEGAAVRKLVDPKLPSEKEVEEHYVRGHFPYRNWCHICVKAKGKDMGHQKEGGKERKIPEYHFDYCSPGDQVDDFSGKGTNFKVADGYSSAQQGSKWEVCNR